MTAIETVIATLQLGIPVARAEFLDEMSMSSGRLSLKGSYNPYAKKPTFEVDFTKEKLGRAHHMKFSAKHDAVVASGHR